MNQKCSFIIMLALAGECVCRAGLTTLADWTFESSQPTGYGATTGGFAAESGLNAGTSVASGYHANSSTTWSSPAGNGSLHSFSSEHWGVGDYYQFSVSTVGFTKLFVQYDQISSSTGPGIFLFEYSSDGVNFTVLGADYAVKSSNWSSGSQTASTTFTENLGSITALDNNSTVTFRLVDDSATAAGGGNVGTGGTDKIDNFIISGNVMPAPEPAWGEYSGAGLLAMCGVRLWRQRQPHSATVG